MTSNSRFTNSADIFLHYVDYTSRLPQEVPFLASVFDKSVCSSLIEFGCGPGAHALALAEAGYDITATDIEDTFVQRARRKKHPRLRVRKANLCSLSPRLKSEGPYDGAYCLGNTILLLPNVSDIERAFTGMAGLLKPSAPLLIHLVNVDVAGSGAKRFSPVKSSAHPDGGDIFLTKVFMPSDDPLGPGLFMSAVHRKPDGTAELIESRNTTFLDVNPSQLIEMASSCGFRKKNIYRGLSVKEGDVSEDQSLSVVFERK